MSTKHIENLYEFATVQLPEEECKRIEQHLEKCEECQEKLDDISLTLKLLAGYQPPPLSEEFQEKVLQKIREKPFPKPPPEPLFERLKKWYQDYVSSWAIKGVAVAAVATLLIVLTYPSIIKQWSPQEPDMTPKTFEITLSPAKHPIILEAKDIEKILNRIREILPTFKGKVLDIKEISEGKRITISLERSDEEPFFKELGRLGGISKEKEGYRDYGGNIVIILKKN